MARSKTEFHLTGPRKGQTFSPKGLPNVHFVDGVFTSDVDILQLPHLAKVLESYGAYPKSKAPESSAPKKAKANAPKKKSKNKPSPKTGELTKESATGSDKLAGAEGLSEGTKTEKPDGSGEAGPQSAKADEDLI